MRQPTVAARAAKPRKARTKGALVKPDYFLRLKDFIGPSAAARAMGISAGTIHKGVKAGMVSKSHEVAAQGIWVTEGYGDIAPPPQPEIPRTANLGDAVAAPTSEGVILMLVQVPKGNASMLLKTAEMLGATVVVQG